MEIPLFYIEMSLIPVEKILKERLVLVSVGGMDNIPIIHFF
jgi:hypothetical protein